VLVGLPRDIGNFPAFRRGKELWADRAMFLAGFGVQVAAECEDSENLVFVPLAVPTALSTHLLPCANSANPLAADFILSTDDEDFIEQRLADMNAHIRAEAEARGFAYFELAALYGRPDLKPPFSVVALLTTAEPYGSLVGLDGVHPTAAGSTVLAAAAARAINERYDLGIPLPGGAALVAAGR
jgi:hypothetical protein